MASEVETNGRLEEVRGGLVGEVRGGLVGEVRGGLAGLAVKGGGELLHLNVGLIKGESDPEELV